MNSLDDDDDDDIFFSSAESLHSEGSTRSNSPTLSSDEEELYSATDREAQDQPHCHPTPHILCDVESIKAAPSRIVISTNTQLRRKVPIGVPPNDYLIDSLKSISDAELDAEDRIYDSTVSGLEDDLRQKDELIQNLKHALKDAEMKYRDKMYDFQRQFLNRYGFTDEKIAENYPNEDEEYAVKRIYNLMDLKESIFQSVKASHERLEDAHKTAQRENKTLEKQLCKAHKKAYKLQQKLSKARKVIMVDITDDLEYTVSEYDRSWAEAEANWAPDPLRTPADW